MKRIGLVLASVASMFSTGCAVQRIDRNGDPYGVMMLPYVAPTSNEKEKGWEVGIVVSSFEFGAPYIQSEEPVTTLPKPKDGTTSHSKSSVQKSKSRSSR